MFKQFQESNYYVSEEGKVYNKKTNRYLKGSLDRSGYLRLKINGRNLAIHRIVLETFKPIKDMHLLEVNHIDGNKTNNNLNNLEWVTHQENMTHAVKNNLTKECSRAGIKNNHAKLNEEKVRAIRLDNRSCQAIANDYGVVKSTISAIKNYKLWKDVK